MAYIEILDDQKPKFEKTLVRDLNHEVIEDLCLLLNPKLPQKDYRSLAGKMGFKYLYVKNLDLKENPTEELLMHWWSGSGTKTVTALIELFVKIDRYDAIEALQPHEYTVIEPKKKRPFSIASSSSAKEPTENDSSDISSYMPSDDDSLSIRNSRAMSFPSSEPPGSYKSSDASTVCAEDYDTDEELNQKMGSMQPKQTHDDSPLCHPYYMYRKGSNASDSTTSSAHTNNSSKNVPLEEINVHKVHLHHQPPHLPSPLEADLPPQFTSQPIMASDKVALLIGNQNYDKLVGEQPLTFPHKDVFDFRRTLEDLGFTVLSLVDLTLREMRTVMLAFCKLLGPGVFAVFYFAGHGYEESGENYLMPVDASPSRAANEFIAAQEILLEMRLTRTALNLLIIDACRVKGVNTTGANKPCGLRKEGAFGNTIIAYSCQSQMPAFEHHHQKNGVYMSELLPKIKEDRRIEHILMDVNSAVNGNPHVIQRPVFETDTIGDCRLTCKVDIDSHGLRQDRSEKWTDATTVPDSQIFERKEENVDFQLSYKNIFCNIIQLDIHLRNNNNCPLCISEMQLLNGEQLETVSNRIRDVVSPGDWTQVQQFRVRNLQRIKQRLLLVLQVKACLIDARGDPTMEYLIELKLDAGYPLVSSCLMDFHHWIRSDTLPGHGKNTWV